MDDTEYPYAMFSPTLLHGPRSEPMLLCEKSPVSAMCFAQFRA